MSLLSQFNDPIGWTFLGSIAVFILTELYALATKTVGDTFSDRIWAWLAGRVARPRTDTPGAALYGPNFPAHIRLFAYQECTDDGFKIVHKGIRWNTFRWFSAAWLTLGLFTWLWTHFFLGWFAG
jgi:hypothetical protein